MKSVAFFLTTITAICFVMADFPTQQQRDDILSYHRTVREGVNPPAANMMFMVRLMLRLEYLPIIFN